MEKAFEVFNKVSERSIFQNDYGTDRGMVAGALPLVPKRIVIPLWFSFLTNWNIVPGCPLVSIRRIGVEVTARNIDPDLGQKKIEDEIRKLSEAILTEGMTFL